MSNANEFLKQEERFAERYARFVIRNRLFIVALITLMTVVLGYFVKDMDVRNDPDTLLPASNRYVATNLYAEEKFGMGNLMVFALRVKEGDIFQPWFINKVQEIHGKLEALPNARSANFIDLAAQKIKYMGADENGLIFKRLIPTEGISTSDPELAKQQLAFLEEGIRLNPVMAPMLVSMEDANGKLCAYEDYDKPHCTAKAAYIIADYDDGVKDIYLPWVREVRKMMDEHGQDDRFELLVAGEPYFLAWMLADLVDKWWLFVISIAIVVLVLWLEFRNWRGAVFPLVGVFATIIMTLGLMGFTQFKLTTMMVLTPMLLLAIGIGHSVQVTRRYMLEETAHEDGEKAATYAISHTIVPATLSIVTDMVGFATLALVDISFYKDYAYFGMFGMLTLLLTTTTLIPILMTWFPCSHKHTHEGHGWERAMGGFITRLIVGPGKWIPIGAVALALAVSVHYTKLLEGTADDLMPGVEKGINYARAAFKEESVTIQQLLRLNEIMPGVISVSIPIRGKEPAAPLCTDKFFPESLYEIEDKGERAAQCLAQKQALGCWDPEPCGAQGVFNDAAVLADLERFEHWLRAHPFVGYTGSYAQYVRLVNMLLTAEPGEKPQLKDLAIPTKAYLTAIDPDDDRDPTEIVQLYNGLLETMTSEGDMDSFVSRDWNEGVVLGFINTMHPAETHQVTMDIQQYIEEHKNDEGFRKVNFGLRCADASCDSGALATDGPDYVRPGLGGFLGATEATREVAMDNWLLSPMQTALAIFVIAALMFRSLLVAGILVLTLFITLFTQYGLGGYFTAVENWSGNLAFHLIVTLSIAMGLGVDYGIYMVSRQGVLHNPASDRRTTEGVFHVAEGGLPIPGDKKAVPKETFAGCSPGAQSAPDLLTLPFTGTSPDPGASMFVSLLLRPVVCPEVPGVSPGKIAWSPLLRARQPGQQPRLRREHLRQRRRSLPAGQRRRPRRRALDRPHRLRDPRPAPVTAHQEGRSACRTGPRHRAPAPRRHVLEADPSPNATTTAAPSRSPAATSRGCHRHADRRQLLRLLQEGGEDPDQLTPPTCSATPRRSTPAAPRLPELRPRRGVRAQTISAPASRRTPSRSGLALRRDHGCLQPGGLRHRQALPGSSTSPGPAHGPPRPDASPGPGGRTAAAIRLQPGKITYVQPNGYKVEMAEAPGACRPGASSAPPPEGTFCHKPCTVSGGGKSEISKSISSDLDRVQEIFDRDYTDRFRPAEHEDHDPSRKPLSPERSLGSVIKLLTPPQLHRRVQRLAGIDPAAHPGPHLPDQALLQTRLGATTGANISRWTRSTARPATSSRLARSAHHRHLPARRLRPGRQVAHLQGAQDFIAGEKIQMEDDISASVVVPAGRRMRPRGPGSRRASIKLVPQLRIPLFQRPDDAIIPGFDKQTEARLAQAGNFMANYEPLSRRRLSGGGRRT
jgi:uncharacterized protein